MEVGPNRNAFGETVDDDSKNDEDDVDDGKRRFGEGVVDRSVIGLEEEDERGRKRSEELSSDQDDQSGEKHRDRADDQDGEVVGSEGLKSELFRPLENRRNSESGAHDEGDGDAVEKEVADQRVKCGPVVIEGLGFVV